MKKIIGVILTMIVGFAVAAPAASAHLDAINAIRRCALVDIPANGQSGMYYAGWSDYHVYGDREIAVRVMRAYHSMGTGTDRRVYENPWTYPIPDGTPVQIWDCHYIGDNSPYTDYVGNISFQWVASPFNPTTFYVTSGPTGTTAFPGPMFYNDGTGPWGT